MDLHFESKSDLFVACIHLICQPLSFVVGTCGRINHNIIKAHDLVTQFVPLYISADGVVFFLFFDLSVLSSILFLLSPTIQSFSHASHSYETKFRRIKKEEKYSLTLILHSLFYAISTFDTLMCTF